MAALPPSNTARAFVTYTVSSHTHTMMARCDGAMSDGDVSEEMSAFIEAMSPLVLASVFVKFERSDVGSNVRVPAVWSGITEWGTVDGPEAEAPMFFSFTGKDVGGHKARVDIFGRGRAVGDSWRIAEVDDSSIAAALAELRTSSAIWNSIGDVGVIWNSYANRSVAQHWVKQLRSG